MSQKVYPSRSVATTERLSLCGHSFQRIHDLHHVVDERHQSSKEGCRSNDTSHDALPKGLFFPDFHNLLFNCHIISLYSSAVICPKPFRVAPLGGFSFCAS